MIEIIDLLPIVIVALLLWLAGLTVVFYRLLSHYRKIARKAHDGDLVSAIEKLIQDEKKNAETVAQLSSVVAELKEAGRLPVQKVGLVRFNPFNETGGDQSFSLCFLNGKDDGFVMTALHTRDRTRVYTKPIERGASKIDLSKEETRALKEAQKKK